MRDARQQFADEMKYRALMRLAEFKKEQASEIRFKQLAVGFEGFSPSILRRASDLEMDANHAEQVAFEAVTDAEAFRKELQRTIASEHEVPK